MGLTTLVGHLSGGNLHAARMALANTPNELVVSARAECTCMIVRFDVGFPGQGRHIGGRAGHAGRRQGQHRRPAGVRGGSGDQGAE